MKTMFLFYLCISLLDTMPKKVVIEMAKIDQVNVSEISDQITVVRLKNIELKNPGSEKIFLINEKIFIFQRYMEEGKFCSYVYRFDNDGNYKGKLDTKDPATNEELIILDMLYDDNSNFIFLVFSKGYGEFDLNGNRVSYNNYNWQDDNRAILTPFMFIFKGQLWFEEIARNKESKDIRLVHTDLSFQSKEILKRLKSYPSDYKGVLPSINLSSCNNELYVSFNTDNIIYSVNKGALSPVFKFEVKNRSASESAITLNQKMVGKYVKNGYWNNSIEYDFLYNTEINKSYNIKYLRDQDMVYVSGIKDDKYNTGYFKFNPTNQEDYIYFIKNPAQLKESILYDPKQSDPMLFLVKLK